MLLYKYRSIGDFRRFVDIIVHNRLYAALYSELNDPLEGHYLYHKDGIPQTVIEEIRYGKGKTRICSLSNTPNDYLMWSHYADGYRGVVIGLIAVSNDKPVPVEYSNKLPSVERGITPREILLRKLNVWSYEKEHRILTAERYIQVEVKQIILGQKMNQSDKTLIENLAKRLSQNIVVTESERASYEGLYNNT